MGDERVAQWLSKLDVVVEASGFADGPAQPLRDYLVEKGTGSVTTILHPLLPEGPGEHRIETVGRNFAARVRTVRLPSRPPYTFPLDLFVPVLPPKADVVFAFNNLAAAKAIAWRRGRPLPQVVFWAVDFVPDRFGKGSLMTHVYDRLDRRCCLRADLRVELSDAARRGRDARHRLPPGAAPVELAPMGAWLRRVPTTGSQSLAPPSAVYMGHLVPRQGVMTFLEALAELRQRGLQVRGDIIGGGPQEKDLKRRAAELAIADSVTFHGFVEDRREVERLLSKASVGVAPYRDDPETFSRYADPGKLKAYLAAGLPIVVTAVPPNAAELAASAGAEVVGDHAAGIADGIATVIASERGWQARHEAALSYAREFDWPIIFDRVLRKLQFFDPPTAS